MRKLKRDSVDFDFLISWLMLVGFTVVLIFLVKSRILNCEHGSRLGRGAANGSARLTFCKYCFYKHGSRECILRKNGDLNH